MSTFFERMSKLQCQPPLNEGHYQNVTLLPFHIVNNTPVYIASGAPVFNTTTRTDRDGKATEYNFIRLELSVTSPITRTVVHNIFESSIEQFLVSPIVRQFKLTEPLPLLELLELMVSTQFDVWVSYNQTPTKTFRNINFFAPVVNTAATEEINTDDPVF